MAHPTAKPQAMNEACSLHFAAVMALLTKCLSGQFRFADPSATANVKLTGKTFSK